MNKEEIEELKDFTIDLTDIDELALGLEVCSKKSNMVIQKFADTIIQLQQENKHLKDLQKNMDKQYDELEQENLKYKEVIEKAIDKLYCWGEALDPEFQKIMLDILKKVK